MQLVEGCDDAEGQVSWPGDARLGTITLMDDARASSAHRDSFSGSCNKVRRALASSVVLSGTLTSLDTRRRKTSHNTFPAFRPAICAFYFQSDVLQLRAGGLSLPAAMARAAASAGSSPQRSIFAGVRRLHPSLRVHVLDKPALLAVTRAIEDECCAGAQRPVLLGSFQERRFYQEAALRWADLARSAEQTTVFADFERARLRPGPLAEIPVPADSPLRREWALVCDAPDQPACVTAWERPGQARHRDQNRIFEVMWSVDPQVVRSAARIGTVLAAAVFPEVGGDRLAARLGQEPGPGSADLRRASGVIERTLDYLTTASRRSRDYESGVPG